VIEEAVALVAQTSCTPVRIALSHVGGLAHVRSALDVGRGIVDTTVRISDASVFTWVVHAGKRHTRTETASVSRIPPAHIDVRVASTLT
jgi:hypothetical protein